MHARPLVSVLIPVFNVENYVADAVNSIRNQTYENLEIVIVDDCSQDRTYTICESLANKDSRIKLFRNTKNSKIALTLNLALAKSTGTFIARMDGDDISAPDRIARQMDYLYKHQEVALVGVNLIGIDDIGNTISKFEHISDGNILLASIKYVTPVSHVWVARRDVYDLLGGYREIPGCEDYDFLLRMISKKLIIANIPDYFGYYVRLQRTGNTQTSIGLRQRKMFDYVYNLYIERQGEKCVDSFSPLSMETNLKAWPISNFLYRLSSKALGLAIKEKANRNFLLVSFYIFFTIISPHQVKYLLQRINYRIIRNKI